LEVLRLGFRNFHVDGQQLRHGRILSVSLSRWVLALVVPSQLRDE
jgi:hypothetical protein